MYLQYYAKLSNLCRLWCHIWKLRLNIPASAGFCTDRQESKVMCSRFVPRSCTSRHDLSCLESQLQDWSKIAQLLNHQINAFQILSTLLGPPDPEEPAKVWSKSPGPRTGCWLMGLMHPKVIPTGNSSLRLFRYLSVIGISLGISTKARSKNRRAHLTSCSTEVGGIRNHAKLTVM